MPCTAHVSIGAIFKTANSEMRALCNGSDTTQGQHLQLGGKLFDRKSVVHRKDGVRATEEAIKETTAIL